MNYKVIDKETYSEKVFTAILPRIEDICSGTFVVNSIINKGTEIIRSIPKKEEDKCELFALTIKN